MREEDINPPEVTARLAALRSAAKRNGRKPSRAELSEICGAEAPPRASHGRRRYGQRAEPQTAVRRLLTRMERPVRYRELRDRLRRYTAAELHLALEEMQRAGRLRSFTVTGLSGPGQRVRTRVYWELTT
jgi:hypothetical protein